MSKKQPAYFYDSMPVGERPKVIAKVMPYTYDIHSKVVEVMGADYQMHALYDLMYDHTVSLYFRFKTKEAMQEAEGQLGNDFKYRSRMFQVWVRDECYPDEDGYWTLIITGKGRDKPLYPRP
jgi:hypothetical protein